MRLSQFAAAMVAAFLLTAACQSRPQPDAAPLAPSFAHAQLIAVTPAAGFAFSPDGRSFLVSSDADGNTNVYAQALTGGAPAALTASFERKMSALSYFPSDDRVLMGAARGGDAPTRLYVRGLEGALRDLTPDGETEIHFVGWRQDGSGFWAADNRRVRDAFDLYEYDAASLERRLIYQNDGMDIGAISRDGRWLALTQRHGSAGADLHLIDLNAPAPAPRLITAHSGSINYNVFEFAPDGRSIAYSTNEHGPFVQAWRYDLASGEKTPIMEAQADVLSVTSSPSGRYRVFVTSVETLVIDQDTDRALPLADHIRDVRFNRDESQIAFRLANDPWPQDVFVSDLDGAHIRRLVHSDAAQQ